MKVSGSPNLYTPELKVQQPVQSNLSVKSTGVLESDMVVLSTSKESEKPTEGGLSYTQGHMGSRPPPPS